MIGSSLSGITFAGLSSGIDSDSIVSRLIALENVPVQRMQAQQAQIRARQTILQQLKGQLNTLSGAAMSLNSASAFAPITAKSSDEEIATVSAGATAAAGEYRLTVSKLAQAHKISSSAKSDTTSALGASGLMVVNGKGVTVDSSDSLTAIAHKVNSAQAGVVASIIDGGSGSAYLTMTAAKTGADAKIQVSDLTGPAASSLGLATGSDAIRQPVTNGATSSAFSSSTTPVGTLLGATGLSSMGFTINGISVTVDLQNQSLADIASAINAAGTGATAAVRTETVDSVTTYRLDITGASTPTFVDTDGALKALGVIQKGYGTQLIAAQDAEYTLDGVSLTSAANSITKVIPDVTLTLLKANETTPETATLSFSQDNSLVKTKVKEFMSAYNGVVDFIKSQSGFDKETFQAGPLFGDSMALQTEDSIAGIVFQDVAGLSGAYSNLAELGFGFDEGGKLKLDEATLDAALATSPSAVGEVFRAAGSSTASALQYVSSTSKTVSSGTGAYDVVISQLATKGSYTAEAAQTGDTAQSENLTFSGSLVGSDGYTLLIPSGYSQSAIVSLINTDAKLKDLLVASVESGSLKLTSKTYGANGNFAVVSNVAASGTSSGIGTISAGTTVTGVDVAGTINGEDATGNGQYLSGKSGNATTDGLQVLYTGTSTGSVGSIKFTKGIAALTGDLMTSFTDSINGVFTTNDHALQSQIDTLSDSIKELQDRIALKEQALRLKFAQMEQTISQLQSQQARLGSLNVK